MVNEVFTKISKALNESNLSEHSEESSDDDDESIQMSPGKFVEESKEECPDLSISLINKQIGAVSENSSSAIYSEEAPVKTLSVHADNFRQTDLKSYFKK